MKLFFNLFRGLGNNKRKLLELEVVNLTRKNAILEEKLSKEINKSSETQTLLKRVLNELTEYKTKNNELKTSNILLEKELLKKNKQLEKVKEKLYSERKGFKTTIKELEKELSKRYIIKTLKPTKPPKQTMSIKSSTVQSKIIKGIKEDLWEVI